MAGPIKFLNVIEPDRCLLEDYEIISFPCAEDLDLYSYWHDQLRSEGLADPYGQSQKQKQKVQQPAQQNEQKAAKAPPEAPSASPAPVSSLFAIPESPIRYRGRSKSQQSPLSSTPSQVDRTEDSPIPKDHVERSATTVPGNGLSILNSQHYKTMPRGKVMAKYKLTKIYNKLRGIQMRRNLVFDRTRTKKLEESIAKCPLNTWLAYTALQALRVPGDNPNQLSTIAVNHNPRLITIPQSQMNKANGLNVSRKKNKKKIPQPQINSNAPPLHFVYIDPNDIVTYSNKIFPQQIVDYKKHSHILPPHNSKRSSSASYDVVEIMDVLANSDKTNVTITRNANKPAPCGFSIYSHSTNLNTQGIVSTQLHLQARSYLEAVTKLYHEEAAHLVEEGEKLRNEPSISEQIGKYIKMEHAYSSTADSSKLNPSESKEENLIFTDTYEEEEDVIDKIEQEILSIVRPNEANTSDRMEISEVPGVQ